MTPRGGSDADIPAPSVFLLACEDSGHHYTYVDIVTHDGRGCAVRKWNGGLIADLGSQ